jgi:hypothetical protein
MIELSQAQVDQIVRAASGAGNMSVLLSGSDDVRQALGAAREQLENPRVSRSLLLGLMVLASFPADGSYLPLGEAAGKLEVSASTTHRYCQTLMAVGLLEQDSRSRRYRQAA